MAANNDQRLVQTFVELADTLVDDFDVIDFLHILTSRCVELLGAAAAGLMLADHQGQLRVAAASMEKARVLELFELQVDEGPCLECYRTGRPVINTTLEQAAGRWPQFAQRVDAAGFRSVDALPMRLRSDVIGALNIFRTEPDPLSAELLTLGQALADIATISLLQQRAMRQRELVAEQLQAALTSRIVIEQAKGILAERSGSDVDQAFAIMRSFARSHNRRLSDIAREIIDGTGDGRLLTMGQAPTVAADEAAGGQPGAG